jgi:hypothetical protein
MSTARIAYVGVDRQLHVVTAQGKNASQWTFSLANNPLLMWGKPDIVPCGYAWPCWSPDGSKIACFQLPTDQNPQDPVQIHVLEDQGIKQHELMQIPGRIPVYMNWQPNGEGLAVLLQTEEHMELAYCSLDKPGQLRVLYQAAPLFFDWGPEARRVYVHAGSPSQPEMNAFVVRDTEGELPDEVLPQTPGRYCRPLILGNSIVHVAHVNGRERLVCSDLLGENEHVLLEYEGLGAAMPARSRKSVVFSSAPNAGQTPYRGASLISLIGKPAVRLTDDDILCFFWSDKGEQLVYIRMIPESNFLSWCSVRPNENPVELIQFRPSREMLYYLHFFDQFAETHQLISEDGRYLVFSGIIKSEAPENKPQIYVLDLRGAQPLKCVGQGTFGCFEPCAVDQHSIKSDNL